MYRLLFFSIILFITSCGKPSPLERNIKRQKEKSHARWSSESDFKYGVGESSYEPIHGEDHYALVIHRVEYPFNNTIEWSVAKHAFQQCRAIFKSPYYNSMIWRDKFSLKGVREDGAHDVMVTNVRYDVRYVIFNFVGKEESSGFGLIVEADTLFSDPLDLHSIRECSFTMEEPVVSKANASGEMTHPYLETRYPIIDAHKKWIESHPECKNAPTKLQTKGIRPRGGR